MRWPVRSWWVTLVYLLAVIVGLSGPAPSGPRLVYAQQFGISASTFGSAFTIVNLEPSTASVLIEFFDLNGTVVLSKSFTLEPRGTKTIYLPTSTEFPLPPGFVGSAAISADRRLAVSVNTQRIGPDGQAPLTEPWRVDTVLALDDRSIGPRLWMPQVMNNAFPPPGSTLGWSSICYVQNTSASPVGIRVIIKERFSGAVTYNATVTLPAQGVATIDHTKLGLPDRFAGSMVVEATDGASPLAGTCNFFNSGQSAEASQFNSYRAFNSGAKTWYAPLVFRTYYDYTSGITIQNVGANPTTITINFVFQGPRLQGRTVQKTLTCQNVQPDQSCFIYLKPSPDFPGWSPEETDFVFGSARIDATENVVVIVNTSKTPSGGKSPSATYTAFTDSAKTNSVVLPQVTSAFYGFSSGFSFVNAGTARGCYTYTFRWEERYRQAFNPGEPPAYTGSVCLEPGEVKQRFVPDELRALTGKYITDFNGSLEITGDQPVFAVSNLDYRIDAIFDKGLQGVVKTLPPGGLRDRQGDPLSQANGLNY